MRKLSACLSIFVALFIMSDTGGFVSKEDVAFRTFGSPLDTSLYLIGSVSVNVVFVESDGSIDPNVYNWTDETRETFSEAAQSGMQWWSNMNSNAHVTYQVISETIETGYEPTLRDIGSQYFWISEVMSKTGIDGYNILDMVGEYNIRKRNQTGLQWSFTIFAVNGELFSDYRYAMAFINGPYMVVSSLDSGFFSTESIIAHETGHIFGALDQYREAGTACNAASGYLNVETQNSEQEGCLSDVPSIMRGYDAYYNNQLDPYAAGQVGWMDSDGDGVLDPVDDNRFKVYVPTIQR